MLRLLSWKFIDVSEGDCPMMEAASTSATRTHITMSQETVIFILAVIRTLNLTRNFVIRKRYTSSSLWGW